MLGPTSESAIPSPCVLARGWVPRSPLIHTCHTSARTQRRGDTWERRGGKKWHFGEQTHLPLPVEAPRCLTVPLHADRRSWPCGWAVGPVLRSTPS